MCSINHSYPSSLCNITTPLPNATLSWSEHWTPYLAARIAITTTALVLNVAVLIFHAIQPSLITNFTVYILALFVFNCVYMIGFQAWLLYTELYAINMGMYGVSVCLLHRYCQLVISVVPTWAHLQMAANRLFAVITPFYYRDHHTRKMALLICCGTIVLVHVICLPGFITTIPHRYRPITAHYGVCEDNLKAIYHWTRADNIINRVLPLCLIVGIYICVFVERLRSRRTRTTVQQRPGVASRDIPMASTSKQTVAASAHNVRSHPIVIKPFLILSWVTISMILCWAPLDICYFLSAFFAITVPLPFH
ncbi:uncharacterized protein LOC129595695 [Paramacrobiotus metropolitanus]|uniref:uncharacterized protein LOC129595695 n=1 Tax=Paramacrobiotus metropolitanus TaxID=2943436 RepID=UPI0024465372|nr:uncharacterized protein LOC129595695 [Paramacrobiotus metropolitanus]